ncbi:MAG: Uma2 family endonuclease [Candidatus Helarchaeota archaeon]
MVITLNNKPLLEPYSIYIPDITFETLLNYVTEDISCELLDGVLVIRSPASFLHESIFTFLISILRIYGSINSLGVPVGSRFMIKLSEKWAPEPDIIFLTPEDQRHLKNNYLIGAPSVVFEILSKTTRHDDLKLKLPQYLKYGVKEIWIIDPEEKHITIHWKDASKSWQEHEWAKSKIISKFRIKVSWLWKPNSLNIREILEEIENQTNSQK